MKKYLIFSDLHGASDSAEIIIEKFNKYECVKMLCLGDILYHGPRNDLPDNYNPKKVIEILNQYSDKIIAIRGNCDAEVDQMVLKFKITNKEVLVLNNKVCHFEHGHHLDELSTTAPIIIYGHTHIPEIRETDLQLFLNPGSITIPKNGNPRTFIILDSVGIRLYDINDNLIQEYIFK